jgi:hypothetical protein
MNEICDLQQKNVTFSNRGSESHLIDAEMKVNKVG